jgi:hypothetical protein
MYECLPSKNVFGSVTTLGYVQYTSEIIEGVYRGSYRYYRVVYTLYSDDKCKNIIQGTSNTPINSDNQCHLFQFGGSYKAQNISAVIGISVGIFFIVIITACCIYKRPCCNKNNNSPFIFTSTHDKSIPSYAYNNSDLKQNYLSREQLNARLISPSIPTNNF